ncbi:MAG: xylulokinase, partial [Clostridiaceae bacterium]
MKAIGIDLGTSSVKIIIVSEIGEVIASASKDFAVSYPRSGWAEQDPKVWWEATEEGLKEVLVKSSIPKEEIKAIGLSGQMHGLVVLDDKGEPIRPAILWCDQRTEAECDYLNNEIGRDKVSQYTGNIALTGFTAPKLLWMKNNEPERFSSIEHILLPKDYIRYKLTGEFATEVSDASGTLILDVEKRQWSQEMIELLGINEEMLPKVYESWEVTGKVSSELAGKLGLSEATVVVGGGGDQAAGAVGGGAVKSGIISAALGTSGVIFASSDDYQVDKDNRLHSFCHGNGRWHQMGVMLSAASCLKWWIEEINKDTTPDAYERFLKEASEVPAGGKGLFFLPYLMGERTPYSDPRARGVFIGLDITTTRGDMTRAVMEGVAFGLRDSLEILKSLEVPIDSVRVSGGGAQSPLWRQILADILDAEVQVISSKEGPALGAAILALVGSGAYASVDEACDKIIKVTSSQSPDQEAVERYNKLYEVYKG